MSDQTQLNTFVNIVIEQRNNALNSLASALATIQELKSKIVEVEKNETDTENTSM
tara:strand:+ start:1846 stop:2010 length:165 start_codon:yes stop_codon:yes gene_type:complete